MGVRAGRDSCVGRGAQGANAGVRAGREGRGACRVRGCGAGRDRGARGGGGRGGASNRTQTKAAPVNHVVPGRKCGLFSFFPPVDRSPGSGAVHGTAAAAAMRGAPRAGGAPR